MNKEYGLGIIILSILIGVISLGTKTIYKCIRY